MEVNTCVKNMEPLSFLRNPSPNGLLLQGGWGPNHLSFELSSSKGIWLVTKSRKMKENERGKNEGSPKSLVPIFNELSLQSLVSGQYAIFPIQFTKI